MTTLTNEEFYVYGQEEHVLSDMDYGFNPETDEYDVPALEWDGWFGKHWTYYDTEAAREEALEEYERNMEEWVVEYRKELAVATAEKLRQRKALKEMKTLGGNCPELGELLVKMRNELKTA